MAYQQQQQKQNQSQSFDRQLPLTSLYEQHNGISQFEKGQQQQQQHSPFKSPTTQQQKIVTHSMQGSKTKVYNSSNVGSSTNFGSNSSPSYIVQLQNYIQQKERDEMKNNRSRKEFKRQNAQDELQLTTENQADFTTLQQHSGFQQQNQQVERGITDYNRKTDKQKSNNRQQQQQIAAYNNQLSQVSATNYQKDPYSGYKNQMNISQKMEAAEQSIGYTIQSTNPIIMEIEPKPFFDLQQKNKQQQESNQQVSSFGDSPKTKQAQIQAQTQYQMQKQEQQQQVNNQKKAQSWAQPQASTSMVVQNQALNDDQLDSFAQSPVSSVHDQEMEFQGQLNNGAQGAASRAALNAKQQQLQLQYQHRQQQPIDYAPTSPFVGTTNPILGLNKDNGSSDVAQQQQKHNIIAPQISPLVDRTGQYNKQMMAMDDYSQMQVLKFRIQGQQLTSELRSQINDFNKETDVETKRKILTQLNQRLKENAERTQLKASLPVVGTVAPTQTQLQQQKESITYQSQVLLPLKSLTLVNPSNIPLNALPNEEGLKTQGISQNKEEIKQIEAYDGSFIQKMAASEPLVKVIEVTQEPLQQRLTIQEKQSLLRQQLRAGNLFVESSPILITEPNQQVGGNSQGADTSSYQVLQPLQMTFQKANNQDEGKRQTLLDEPIQNTFHSSTAPIQTQQQNRSQQKQQQQKQEKEWRELVNETSPKAPQRSPAIGNHVGSIESYMAKSSNQLMAQLYDDGSNIATFQTNHNLDELPTLSKAKGHRGSQESIISQYNFSHYDSKSGLMTRTRSPSALEAKIARVNQEQELTQQLAVIQHKVNQSLSEQELKLQTILEQHQSQQDMLVEIQRQREQELEERLYLERQLLLQAEMAMQKQAEELRRYEAGLLNQKEKEEHEKREKIKEEVTQLEKEQAVREELLAQELANKEKYIKIKEEQVQLQLQQQEREKVMQQKREERQQLLEKQHQIKLLQDQQEKLEQQRVQQEKQQEEQRKQEQVAREEQQEKQLRMQQQEILKLKEENERLKEQRRKEDDDVMTMEHYKPVQRAEEEMRAIVERQPRHQNSSMTSNSYPQQYLQQIVEQSPQIYRQQQQQQSSTSLPQATPERHPQAKGKSALDIRMKKDISQMKGSIQNKIHSLIDQGVDLDQIFAAEGSTNNRRSSNKITQNNAYEQSQGELQWSHQDSIELSNSPSLSKKLNLKIDVGLQLPNNNNNNSSKKKRNTQIQTSPRMGTYSRSPPGYQEGYNNNYHSDSPEIPVNQSNYIRNDVKDNNFSSLNTQKRYPPNQEPTHFYQQHHHHHQHNNNNQRSIPQREDQQLTLAKQHSKQGRIVSMPVPSHDYGVDEMSLNNAPLDSYTSNHHHHPQQQHHNRKQLRSRNSIDANFMHQQQRQNNSLINPTRNYQYYKEKPSHNTLVPRRQYAPHQQYRQQQYRSININNDNNNDNRYSQEMDSFNQTESSFQRLQPPPMQKQQKKGRRPHESYESQDEFNDHEEEQQLVFPKIQRKQQQQQQQYDLEQQQYNDSGSMHNVRSSYGNKKYSVNVSQNGNGHRPTMLDQASSLALNSSSIAIPAGSSIRNYQSIQPPHVRSLNMKAPSTNNAKRTLPRALASDERATLKFENNKPHLDNNYLVSLLKEKFRNEMLIAIRDEENREKGRTLKLSIATDHGFKTELMRQFALDRAKGRQRLDKIQKKYDDLISGVQDEPGDSTAIPNNINKKNNQSFSSGNNVRKMTISTIHNNNHNIHKRGSGAGGSNSSKRYKALWILNNSGRALH